MAAAQTFEVVRTYTVPSDTTTFTLSSISQSYTHLYCVTNIYNNEVGNGMDYYLQFNGNTTANYAVTKWGGNASNTRSSNRTNAASSMQLFYTTNGSTGKAWTAGQIWIPFYTSSFTKNTHVRGGCATSEAGYSTGFFNSTAAINSMTISASSINAIGAGTTITLYGILKA